jgi:hypothetical protein
VREKGDRYGAALAGREITESGPEQLMAGPFREDLLRKMYETMLAERCAGCGMFNACVCTITDNKRQGAAAPVTTFETFTALVPDVLAALEQEGYAIEDEAEDEGTFWIVFWYEMWNRANELARNPPAR